MPEAETPMDERCQFERQREELRDQWWRFCGVYACWKPPIGMTWMTAFIHRGIYAFVVALREGRARRLGHNRDA